MPRGTLEVLLVSAKDLKNMDVLCQMDSYCTITCRSQEQKSSIAKGQGSEPKWNETFKFNIYEEQPKELEIKIMDSDLTSCDDFVGQVSVPLDMLFEAGEIPTKDYNVVLDKEYKGSIKIGLTFISEDSDEGRGESYDDQGSYSQKRRGHVNSECPGGNSKSYGREEKGYGGSKQSYGCEEESGYGGIRGSSGREEKGNGRHIESYGREERGHGANRESSRREERGYVGTRESPVQGRRSYGGQRGSDDED